MVSHAPVHTSMANISRTLYMRAHRMRNSNQILGGKSHYMKEKHFAGRPRPRHLPWTNIFDSNAAARSICGG